jgi:hypothetical protein
MGSAHFGWADLFPFLRSRHGYVLHGNFSAQ